MKLTTVLPRLVLTGVVAAALLGGRTVQAQTPSLAEVARKEADRRKGTGNAGKVYTNKDLPASVQKPAPPAAAAAETAIPLDPVAAATEQKPEVKPDGETKDEAWWKTRIASAREELRRNEMFAEALQTRINSLGRDFASRDNPVQRARIGQDRAEALSELNRVKQDIDRGKKQIADIEEEARKAGVPPGWLR